MQIIERKIVPIACCNNTHQGELIQLFCLDNKCKNNKVLCTQCRQSSHVYCKVLEIEKIQEELRMMQSLYRLMITLQNSIDDKQFKVDYQEIEYFLKQISEYQACPNLTNLNIICNMVRDKDQFIGNCKVIIHSLLKKISCEKKFDVELISDIGRKLYIRQKLFNEAIMCFDLAIGIKPKVLKFYYYKSWALKYSGKHDEAINCSDLAIKIEPNFIWSWFNKGELLLQLNRYLEAMSCFDKILEFDLECRDLDSGDFVRHINLAVDCYRNIIKQNQDLDTCSHAKAQLRVALNMQEQFQGGQYKLRQYKLNQQELNQDYECASTYENIPQ